MKPIRIAIALLAALLSLIATWLANAGSRIGADPLCPRGCRKPGPGLLYVNGALAAANVAYGGSTAYMQLPAGDDRTHGKSGDDIRPAA